MNTPLFPRSGYAFRQYLKHISGGQFQVEISADGEWVMVSHLEPDPVVSFEEAEQIEAARKRIYADPELEAYAATVI